MTLSTGSSDPGWEAVGFDLDGTLFDHRGAATAGVAHLVRSLDRDPDPALTEAWFALETVHFEAWTSGRVSFTEQRRARVREFSALLDRDVPHDPADADALFERYLIGYRRSWRAYEDAAPLLRELREGGVRVGILTNGPEAQQREKLRTTGLDHLVDVVCTAEGIGFSKPDARAFHALVRGLDTPTERIAFIGDHPEQDVAGARAVGIRAGLVRRDGPESRGLRTALATAE
ncbi:HAD family hydrolase [Microbacterium sediminicola]|uniref:HAD family hydrolase n=1 Tax=Microbacterium sediminicola TaxID=415210 RepID=A0ABN2I8D0_9MICO